MLKIIQVTIILCKFAPDEETDRKTIAPFVNHTDRGVGSWFRVCTLCYCSLYYVPLCQSIYQEAMEKARQTLRTTELRIDADDDHVHFTVEDTGPGIPSDKADFIFEKFTKINMFTEGLGLGLFLCRRVVELMGGTLTLDPQYTNGSRFVLELPLK